MQGKRFERQYGVGETAEVRKGKRLYVGTTKRMGPSLEPWGTPSIRVARYKII